MLWKQGNHTWSWIYETRFHWVCKLKTLALVCRPELTSCQNLRFSLIQAVSQEEPSDRKPDPRPLWMAGHAQLKFVMTECPKTQIRLTGLTLQKHSSYLPSNLRHCRGYAERYCHWSSIELAIQFPFLTSREHISPCLGTVARSGVWLL